MTPCRTLALLLPLCAAAAGCAGPRVNLWPIYFQETHVAPDAPEGLTSSIEVLYPFFGLDRRPGWYSYVVRPLYNYQHDEGEGKGRLQYLWPFGMQTSHEDVSGVHRFWPLFQTSKTHQYFENQWVWHTFLFPLVFTGNRPPQGPYFAVFPVGGVTHGLLGDTFSWFLFPVYSYYRRGDYQRHNILWPFISWGQTADGERALLRFWPFYIHKTQKDKYEHTYALWPFIRWGWQTWDTGEGGTRARRYRAFHPFYSAQELVDEDGVMLTRQSQVLGLTMVNDYRRGWEGRQWSFLFGILKWQQTPVYNMFRFWPFYKGETRYASTHRDWRQSYSGYILWPFIWMHHNTIPDEKELSYFVIAPFFWKYRTQYYAGDYAGNTAHNLTLWPLVSWQQEGSGSRHFSILSHGWKDKSGGFKKNYRAFFDFFQYHSLATGEKETRVVSRLYHHRRNEDGRYLSVACLMTYDSLGDEGDDRFKSFSLLGGLIKYSWRGEQSRWRLLFIPL